VFQSHASRECTSLLIASHVHEFHGCSTSCFFAECRRTDDFRCNSGMCLSPNLVCNGVGECDDNSDELSYSCSECNNRLLLTIFRVYCSCRLTSVIIQKGNSRLILFNPHPVRGTKITKTNLSTAIWEPL